MRSVCIFCGSVVGSDPAFVDAARQTGRELTKRGIRILYGGGSTGLMGTVADAALSAGGHVTGVIPRMLWEREVGHRGLSDLRIVESMHERKALLSELSEAFLALPGGIGTMDELFESWTWAQLGVHRKPVALLNVAGYYDPLLSHIDMMLRHEFLRPEYRRMLLVDSELGPLLDRMHAFHAPAAPRWVEQAQA